jgi:hypothetical protein
MSDEEFENVVRELRKRQRDFFASKNPAALAEAKRLEKEIDSELERRRPPKKGPTLFDLIDSLE